jgi:hypothetical protein
MTNRVSYAPQDFHRKCIQAERDHESRKLTVLLERVKLLIAHRENPDAEGGSFKRPATTLTIASESVRLPGRPVPFER